MSQEYFEELYRREERDAEWRMLNVALRQRRGHAFHRNMFAAVFWILGIRA